MASSSIIRLFENTFVDGAAEYATIHGVVNFFFILVEKVKTAIKPFLMVL